MEEGRNLTYIAYSLSCEGTPTSERSIRRALGRWGGKTEAKRSPFVKPGFTIDGDTASVTSDPNVEQDLNDTDSLLRERGLDPEDWDVDSLRVAEWGPPGEEHKQLRVNLKRRKVLTMVLPAQLALGRIFPHIEHISSDTEPELVVFVGDQHAPFQDTELHKRFCAFLDDQEPERGVFMGDLVDLPADSRHPTEPDWAADTQDCLNQGAQLILDCREASPCTNWVKLPGNHLERLRRIVIDRLAHWYELTPAKVLGLPDLPPIHDPSFLLRLDELGVEYIKPRGTYHHASYMVSPHLSAKHGSVAKKGSGTSALATLAGLDHSVVMGHTHRQSLVQRTVRQIDGSGRLLQAAETGCMCQIRDGLGYAPGADWSNGFLTSAVWPDGTFKLDLATFVDNRLLWRSERY